MNLMARRRAKRRSVLGHLPKTGVHQACAASRPYLLKHVMIDALEKRLIEALRSVDAHGDVAPAYVHDPMTMSLRENAIQANLMRWDDVRGRYVLTGTGRRRISEGGIYSAKQPTYRRAGAASGILSFDGVTRDDLNS
jgi:hypothetical protein